MSRFRFVSEFAPDYGVKRLCRVLGVSRSGYYTWARRPPSPHSLRDDELAGLITEIHRRSRRTYGAPRIHAELRRLDQRCGRKRVARLMAQDGLVGAHARRRWRTGKPDTAPAPDLVNRNFDPARATRSGPPTSPSSGPVKAGSTSPGLSTCTHGALSAGPCRHHPTPIWSSTPSSWPSNADVPTKSPFIIRTGVGSIRRWPSASGPPIWASHVVRIERGLLRQLGRRGCLGHSQAGIALDLRHQDLAEAGPLALGALRLRRRLLQHSEDPEEAGLPFPGRVRISSSGLIKCACKSGSTPTNVHRLRSPPVKPILIGTLAACTQTGPLKSVVSLRAVLRRESSGPRGLALTIER